MEQLVAHFEADVKLTFVDSHDIELSFPFSAFAKSHHMSKPDISASFPGQPLDRDTVKKFQWERMSLIMEVKPESKQDPFHEQRAGQTHGETIIQLARSARNLMLAHGLLAAFAVGIYGEVARIARFDHSSAIVCKPFNIKRRPDLLQRFFWHFTHPIEGSTVVGCDPTVRRLDDGDKGWVRSRLEELGEEVKGFDEHVKHGRRAIVFDDQTGQESAYIVYKPVDINARLFSRATTVWRAIEDTRSSPDDGAGRLSGDATSQRQPKVRIMKESWRQVVRPSEAWFYHRLATLIPEGKQFGIARIECGGDLGQREVREWQRGSPNVSAMDGHRDLRLSPNPSATSDPHPPSPSGASAVGLSGGPAGSSPTASAHTAPNASTGPGLPYPQHQTFSWAVARGPEFTYRERSHMRFVVTDVGRPVTRFKNTRELVNAFRDAIRGTLSLLFYALS